MAAVVKPAVKNRVGITVVGKDREGVVAAFTKFIFIKGGNIEAIHQNVVQGLFGMYIEASFRAMNRVQFDESLRQLGIDEEMDVNIYHATSSHKNIAVFVTREAHCLEALLEAASDGRLKGRISVVLGTRGDAQGADRGGRHTIRVSGRAQPREGRGQPAGCVQTVWNRSDSSGEVHAAY